MKAETVGTLIVIGILGFLLKAQVLVWGSNVLADSFAGWTGLSFRQGMLLTIFYALYVSTAKVEFNK